MSLLHHKRARRERAGASSDSLHRQHSGEAKITQLHLAIRVDENVGWFDIPVEDVTGVEEVNCTERVVQYRDDVLLVEVNLLGAIEHLLEV